MRVLTDEIETHLAKVGGEHKASDIAAVFGVTPRKARDALKNLTDSNRVRYIQKGTARYYAAGVDPVAEAFHQVMVGMSRIRATA